MTNNKSSNKSNNNNNNNDNNNGLHLTPLQKLRRFSSSSHNRHYSIGSAKSVHNPTTDDADVITQSPRLSISESIDGTIDHPSHHSGIIQNINPYTDSNLIHSEEIVNENDATVPSILLQDQNNIIDTHDSMNKPNESINNFIDQPVDNTSSISESLKIEDASYIDSSQNSKLKQPIQDELLKTPKQKQDLDFSTNTNEMPDNTNTIELETNIVKNTANLIKNSFSILYDNMIQEINAPDIESQASILKTERIYNFLSVPNELEKFLWVGYLICLDSMLYLFTVLPLRGVIVLFKCISMFFKLFISFIPVIKNWKVFNSPKSLVLTLSERTDIVKISIMIICSILLQWFDASQIYHSVRGQALIKLYVIFGCLEVCDKLCSAFGHDILDSLFSKIALPSSARFSLNRLLSANQKLNPILHFFVAIIYVFSHSVILFYQVMTLNVAVNSFNNALLTLLLSNQFTEIKTSVFKRFEKENLFQLSCSDVVERFQLSVFLTIITIRNYIEFSSRFGGLDTIFEINFASFMQPYKLFTIFFSNSSISALYKWINTLIVPVACVYLTELMVDWLKHAFITKFNQIKPTVYTQFRISLYKDLLFGKANRNRFAAKIRDDFNVIHNMDKDDTQWKVMIDKNDSSPVVARRIGLVTLPMTCLIIRVAVQTWNIISVSANEKLYEDDESGISTTSYLSYVSYGNVTRLVNYFIKFATKALTYGVITLFIMAIMFALKVFIGIYLKRMALHDLAKFSDVDVALIKRDGLSALYQHNSHSQNQNSSEMLKTPIRSKIVNPENDIGIDTPSNRYERSKSLVRALETQAENTRGRGRAKSVEKLDYIAGASHPHITKRNPFNALDRLAEGAVVENSIVSQSNNNDRKRSVDARLEQERYKAGRQFLNVSGTSSTVSEVIQETPLPNEMNKTSDYNKEGNSIEKINEIIVKENPDTNNLCDDDDIYKVDRFTMVRSRIV